MQQADPSTPRHYRDSSPARRATRVLVVDDEAMICRFMRNALAGCEVETCQSSEAALERARAAVFEHVFCDLMMPRMNGRDFYEQLVLVRPELASEFTLMTGAHPDASLLKFIERHDLTLLLKPFGLLELTRCLPDYDRARTAAQP